jgi:hypothetical protein
MKRRPINKFWTILIFAIFCLECLPTNYCGERDRLAANRNLIASADTAYRLLLRVEAEIFGFGSEMFREYTSEALLAYEFGVRNEMTDPLDASRKILGEPSEIVRYLLMTYLKPEDYAQREISFKERREVGVTFGLASP